MSPDKKPLKTALGMFSKEEEFVPLSAECDLSGQVSGAGSCCTRGGGCGAWAEKKPRTEQWSHGECQSTEPCSPSGGCSVVHLLTPPSCSINCSLHCQMGLSCSLLSSGESSAEQCLRCHQHGVQGEQLRASGTHSVCSLPLCPLLRAQSSGSGRHVGCCEPAARGQFHASSLTCMWPELSRAGKCSEIRTHRWRCG